MTIISLTRPVVYLFVKTEASRRVYKRLESEHGKILSICIFIGSLLFIGVIIKLVYTILKYFIHIRHIDEIEHIDSIGLLCGFLGIIITLLITLFIEDNHHKESSALNKATVDIRNIATEILNRYESLVPLTSFSERLKELDALVDFTSARQIGSTSSDIYHFYSLNYNLSYGFVQAFNAYVTLNDAETKRQFPKDIIWRDYHERIHKNLFRNKQKSIFKKISNLRPETIHYAILKTGTGEENNSDNKYFRLLSKVVNNRNIQVVKYPQDSNRQIDINEPLQDDLYTITEDDTAGNSDDLKKQLLEKFINQNNKDLRTLQNREVTDISFHDFIPFQFFVSAPENVSVNTEVRCVIIFTNILSLEKYPTNTVSFKSVNHELVQNLLDVHATFKKRYKEQMEETNRFERLFSCKGHQISFLIKRIADTEAKEKENDYLTYLADFDCYSDIKEMFTVYGQNSHLAFDDEVIQNNAFIVDSPHRRTPTIFFSVGLFRNKFVEFFNSLENPYEIIRLFKIKRDAINDETKKSDTIFRNETIKIAPQDTLSSDEDEWKTWSKAGKEDNEYALLTKFTYQGNTCISCGGLTSFGTRCIGSYIRNNLNEIINSLKVNDVEYNGENFAIVFQIEKFNNEVLVKIIDRVVIPMTK